MNKWIYNFGAGLNEGNKTLFNLLGNKGANLSAMAAIGIPVPPGFTITTEACNYFFDNQLSLPGDLTEQIEASLALMEDKLSLKFGSDKSPLLVSIRSGASVSMPGMMDTILNLGLNDETVVALARNTKNERFAYDCYRRFIQMYSQIVLGLSHYDFEDLMDLKKQDHNIVKDSDLSLEHLKELIEEYKLLIKKNSEVGFPQDVKEQLILAIKSVFSSWNNQRARKYRRIHNYADDLGTAVNIQAMVFGNMDDNSATGVAFTRDPSTGENYIFGEYLLNAQGEDVVAGIRTPQVISSQATSNHGVDLPALELYMKDAYSELTRYFKQLEKYYKDMQDVEFTIEQGKVWILQTRSGKRSAKASIKIAVDMVREGLIDERTALLNINADSIEKILHPTIDHEKKYEVLTKGLPAAPGAATGKICFSSDITEQKSGKEKIILVRHETSPEDIHGMNAAEGILTSKGGMTTHAAVVARGMGKSCVCGASEVVINYQDKTILIGKKKLNEGDVITINGSTGEVILGEVMMVLPELTEDYLQVMSWANKYKKLSVRANAETPLDAKIAKDFGAEGIGLCRTEHMFFNIDRINVVREMILCEDTIPRQKALDELLDMQTKDFVEIFTIMQTLPVNIRLLDPPLHEFLVSGEKEIALLADKLRISPAKVKARIEHLKEQNPMLGHRGCRLGISFPEIYEMQAKAIFKAMKEVYINRGIIPTIEIMIPFIITDKEFTLTKKMIENVAKKIISEEKFNFQIGTMIELPRACIIADQIAKHADFFSFGTNDLTQTTLGLSRDDAASFMGNYINKGIISIDPFLEIDRQGVGELVKIAIERGRKTKPNLKIGICGEHGGNPNSINFFSTVGLDYVSCSPYRVPIAIIAAAQAAIRK